MTRMYAYGKFQPTLPARGATPVLQTKNANLNISTHAPRTGSDLFGMMPKEEKSNFNPRSPHGERPLIVTLSFQMWDFNPRSPHGERPVNERIYDVQQDFNPRSPHGERRGLGGA